jgi:hypothetical protein
LHAPAASKPRTHAEKEQQEEERELKAKRSYPRASQGKLLRNFPCASSQQQLFVGRKK